jgi:hypothetical protein
MSVEDASVRLTPFRCRRLVQCARVCCNAATRKNLSCILFNRHERDVVRVIFVVVSPHHGLACCMDKGEIGNATIE